MIKVPDSMVKKVQTLLEKLVSLRVKQALLLPYSKDNTVYAD
jgi:hypothetical protein